MTACCGGAIRRYCLLWLAALASAQPATQAAAQAGAEVRDAGPLSDARPLNIPQGPTRQSLLNLAESIGAHIVFADDVLAEGAASPAVVGAYTIAAALNKLLENTGLSYTFIEGKLLIIESPGGAGDSSAMRGGG